MKIVVQASKTGGKRKNKHLFFIVVFSENTRKLIQETWESFGIDTITCHVVYVADNGANLVSALKDEPHLRCICHCINLAVTQAIESCPQLVESLESCRKLVTHFKRCELQQDVETRWNSIYEMIHSIMKVEKELMALLATRKEGHLMDDIDRMLLNDMCVILEPFKMASEFLSADKEPTLHLVLPFVKLFNDICELKSHDSHEIKELKKNLREKVKEKIWLTEFHFMAIFVHPETKSLPVCYNQNY